MTMAIHRNATWLTAGALLLLLAGDVLAQRFQPFGPIDYVEEVHDMQPWAPYDADPFGAGPSEPEGYFFNYSRLHWSFSKPNTAQFGDAGLVQTVTDGTILFPQGNSETTAALQNDFTWGNRLEAGYMNHGEGWMFSMFDVDGWVPGASELNRGVMGINASVQFRDPRTATVGFDVDGDGTITPAEVFTGHPLFGSFVDLDGDGAADDVNMDGVVDVGDVVAPSDVFTTLTAMQQTDMDNWELNKTIRLKPFHNGSQMEVYYGVRYLRIRDSMAINLTGGPLDATTINSVVENNIVGPQAGGRWWCRRGSWRFLVDWRFVPGFNFRGDQQTVFIGSNQMPNANIHFAPAEAMIQRDTNHFSPLTELRVESDYQITRNVAITLGWTGMFVNRVGRGVNTIDWVLPNGGFRDEQEHIFAHGVNAGLKINH